MHPPPRRPVLFALLSLGCLGLSVAARETKPPAHQVRDRGDFFSKDAVERANRLVASVESVYKAHRPADRGDGDGGADAGTDGRAGLFSKEEISRAADRIEAMRRKYEGHALTVETFPEAPPASPREDAVRRARNRGAQ